MERFRRNSLPHNWFFHNLSILFEHFNHLLLRQVFTREITNEDSAVWLVSPVCNITLTEFDKERKHPELATTDSHP